MSIGDPPGMLAIPIVDNGERIVNVRDFSSRIVIEMEEQSRKAQGITDNSCFVRESVAFRLDLAQRSLPEGLRIKLVDGFRPLDAQMKMYDDLYSQLRKDNPAWSEPEVAEETENWISNPYDLGNRVPPHLTGGAVDLTLIDQYGRELNMGAAVNSTDKAVSPFHSGSISRSERKNRMLLGRAMAAQGFVNYSEEWWHWSYGDRRWAFANNVAAIYSLVK